MCYVCLVLHQLGLLVLNWSGDSKLHSLVFDLGRKAFRSPIITYHNRCMVFKVLYHTEKFSSIPSLLRVFVNYCLILLNAFLDAVIWSITCFFFISVASLCRCPFSSSFSSMSRSVGLFYAAMTKTSLPWLSETICHAFLKWIKLSMNHQIWPKE